MLHLGDLDEAVEIRMASHKDGLKKRKRGSDSNVDVKVNIKKNPKKIHDGFWIVSQQPGDQSSENYYSVLRGFTTTDTVLQLQYTGIPQEYPQKQTTNMLSFENYPLGQ